MIKNFMAIHDVHDDEAAEAYKSYFRETFADVILSLIHI